MSFACNVTCAIIVQVAIKKVLQDKRFKNRELQIMKMMNHVNVVSLKHCFYSTTEKDEVSIRTRLPRRMPGHCSAFSYHTSARHSREAQADACASSHPKFSILSHCTLRTTLIIY